MSVAFANAILLTIYVATYKLRRLASSPMMYITNNIAKSCYNTFWSEVEQIFYLGKDFGNIAHFGQIQFKTSWLKFAVIIGNATFPERDKTSISSH